MSLEIFAAQCRHLLHFAAPMLEGLDDSHSAMEPNRGNKSAGWLLGHLCVTGDFARKLCGRDPIGPKDWRNKFSPGTSSAPDAAEYPPMDELRKVFTQIYSDLPGAILKVSAGALDAANPFEPARPAFPTVREFVSYIMTGHLAYHLGQLGDWRRAAGLGHKGLI